MNNTEIDFTIGVLKELKAEKVACETKEHNLRSCENALEEKCRENGESAIAAVKSQAELQDRLDSVRRKLHAACMLINRLPGIRKMRTNSSVRKELDAIYEKAQKFASDHDIHLIGDNMAE